MMTRAIDTSRLTPSDALKLFQRSEDGSLIIFSLFIFVLMLMITGMAVDMMRLRRVRCPSRNVCKSGSFRRGAFIIAPSAPTGRGGIQCYGLRRHRAGAGPPCHRCRGSPAGSGPDDDPDADGVANLLEFGLGMNPLVTDVELLPSGAISGGEFVFTYTKSTAAAGLVFRVETSANLVDWSPVPDVGVGVSAFVETREARIALGGERLFVRLMVE